MKTWIYQITPSKYGGEIGDVENDLQYGKHFTWEIKSHLNDVSVGDLILVQSGKDTRSISARTTDDDEVLPQMKKGIYLEGKVSAIDKRDKTVSFNVLRRFYSNPKPSYKIGQNRGLYDKKKCSLDPSEVVADNNWSIKNITLYGPPGVGKTYNHKKLIAMIESNRYGQKEIFDAIVENQLIEIDVERVVSKIKDEKRFEFLTFHQSFSYEDFIEGYRPDEKSNIGLVDGIFKTICDRANQECMSIQRNISFEEAFQDLMKETVFSVIYQGVNFEVDGHSKDKVRIYLRETGEHHELSIKILQQMYQNEIVNNVEHEMLRYYKGLLEKLLSRFSDDILDKKQSYKNYYLVIDEINRGNISKIFGELITLIEEDKRDTIEVTLPYSKEPFKVPSNLYIIATMNSTDKSIALIDIALRRRFTFLKMQPQELLVPEEARELFKKLNDHITEKLGEEFRLGHSYFMNNNDLEFVKKYKIEPLLEEYFYTDPDGREEAMNILYGTKQ